MEEFRHAEFSGLRNTVPNNRFGLDDLEAAVNVDVDDSKRVALRHGRGALLLSGAYKSLWSDGAIALAVKSQTSLMRIFPDWSEAALRAGLMPGLDMSYAANDSRVFYANGADSGIIQDGASRTWGLNIPTGQPEAEAIGGLLEAGRYQFAVTYLRADRQESGTPPAAVIDLTVDGGIRLTEIPVSADPGVTLKIVYFSKKNDETLYRAGVIPASATTFDYQVEASMQVSLMTQHLRPPPAGHYVDVFNGRTLVGHESTLYYSEPYSLELFDLRKNHQLNGRMTMLAALDGGVYVSTPTGIMWLDGLDPTKWVYRKLKDYGALRGALYFCSRDMVLDGQGQKTVAVFATSQGVCVGEDGGVITNLTQSRYLYPIQDRGALVVRRYRGFTQGLTVFQGTERAASASS